MTGKNVRGVLRYNELKREQGLANLIHGEGFLGEVSGITEGQLHKRFKSLQQRNSRTHTNTLHLSLNFAPGDKLSSARMVEITRDYMEGIGFGTQPYLVYQHLDAAHPHVHIVTTNIDRNGKRIETHNLGKTKSEEARKSLEVKYGLIRAEGQHYTGADLKSLMDPKYGEAPTKAALNSVINHVLANYQFSSFKELNAVLALFHVTAFRGEKESLRYKNRGLAFHFLDGQGKRRGVPIKASSFYSKPTLDRLEKRFNRALTRKKLNKESVSAIVEGVLGNQKASDPKALEKFIKDLLRQRIAIHLVYNASGRLYGVTYVDHQSGCVFKGSELGKVFAANALVARFGLAGGSLSPKKDTLSSVDQKERPVRVEHPSVDLTLPISELFQDSLIIDVGDISDSPYQGPVYPKKKRRKKKDSGSNETKG